MPKNIACFSIKHTKKVCPPMSDAEINLWSPQTPNPLTRRNVLWDKGLTTSSSRAPKRYWSSFCSCFNSLFPFEFFLFYYWVDFAEYISLCHLYTSRCIAWYPSRGRSSGISQCMRRVRFKKRGKLEWWQLFEKYVP